MTNKKDLDWSKFQETADNKIDMTEKKIKFLMGKIENIVRKGENAGYQHLLFPTIFSFPNGFFFSAISCDKGKCNSMTQYTKELILLFCIYNIHFVLKPMLCYVMLCYVTLRYVTLRYVMSEIKSRAKLALQLFTTQSRLLTILYKKPFKNIVGK